VKPSHAANDNLIDQTRTVWQPRLGRDLTREDARQIAESVTGFFAFGRAHSRALQPGAPAFSGADWGGRFASAPSAAVPSSPR
jgi:hypothetical protein